MATNASSLEAVQRATVYICDRTGTHRGQGLLLDLDDEGIVILTCHHVIAPIEPNDLCVRVLQENGQLTDPTAVHYDAERSRPTMDAVVLRGDGLQPTERPLLHALNPQRYVGSLKAIGLTYLQPRRFTAWVTVSTPLEIPVPISGHWPDPPAVYRFPVVFQLTHSTDARPGISGGVVFCEDGVLGLVHFARADAPFNARESYLVPLSVWAEGWPALTERIEIFIDSALRSAAKVKRVRQLQVGLNERERGLHRMVDVDVVIAKYQPAVYIEREEEQIARNALERYGGVVIIGKPLSGKTRLAWQLLRDHLETIVVIPRLDEPPTAFEASSFAGKEVILYFDDLHETARTMRPLLWQERLTDASDQHCLLICTTRDGDDWKRLEKHQAPLLDSLERPNCCVFTSRAFHQGKDLSQEQGQRLAMALGMSKQKFEEKFDGTPGSLVLDLVGMGQRYEWLRDDLPRGDVQWSRLLDAAKLLHVSDCMSYLPAKILRDIAEQIRGNNRINAETWEALQRRTQDAGFGSFDSASYFQTYIPYLERCVIYQPSLEEIQALYPIIKDDHSTVISYLENPLIEGTAFKEQILRERVRKGYPQSYYYLGVYLSKQPGREAEAEQIFREGIKAEQDARQSPVQLNRNETRPVDSHPQEEASVPYTSKIRFVPVPTNLMASLFIALGNLLREQPGREAEAEQAFCDAIKEGNEKLAFFELGRFLARQSGREVEAEQALREAIKEGLGFAYYDLIEVLVNQPGREQEAEQLIRAILHGALVSTYLITSGFYNVYQSLGTLLARQPGREAEAEQAFRDAIALGFTSSNYYLWFLLARQPGRETEAEQAFRDAELGNSGGSKERVQLLFHLTRQPGRQVEAERVSRSLIRTGDIWWGYYFLGLALSGQSGREAEAESALQEAINAGNEFAYYNLGLLLAEQRDRRNEAKQALRRAMDVPGTAKEALSAYEQTILLDSTEEALAAYEQAILLDPNDASAYSNKGGVLADLKRYEEALEAYEQAILLDPTNAPVYYYKGAILYNLKRYGEVLEAFEQAILLDPTFASDFSYNYGKGIALDNLKRYEEALEAFEQAIYLDPTNARAYYDKGRALVNLKRNEEALVVYEQAILLDSTFASDSYYNSNKGIALYNLKRYEEALEAIEQAIRLDPTFARAYYDKGRALYNLKRYEEALEAIEQAILLDPTNARAYYTKGGAFADLKRYEEALEAFEQAIHLDPTFASDSSYNSNKSGVLANLKRYEEALEAVELAIHLNPTSSATYSNKGGVLADLRRDEEALEAFEQAIRLDPTDTLVYHGKGEVLANLKRYEEALEAFDQAIRLDPTFASAYHNKGRILASLKRDEEALEAVELAIRLDPTFALVYLEAFEQAIRLDPTDADAYYYKGRILASLKRDEEALEAFEQAIRLDPTNARAYYIKGGVLYNLKRYEEALEAYEQVIHLKPTFASAYFNKGNILYNLKRYEEVLEAYEQVIHLNPTFASVYHNKGHILASLKRDEEALEAYEQAIRLDPNYAEAYKNRGHIYYKWGEYQRAIADFNEVLRLQPDSANAYLMSGYTYLYLKCIEEARADFQRAAERAPDDVNMHWMVVFASLKRGCPGREIADNLDRIAAIDENSPYAFVCRAVALGLRGNVKAGLRQLEQVLLKYSTSHQDDLFWKGVLSAYDDTTQPEVAIEAIEKALENGLPPVLLTPLYWLQKEKPRFFEEYAQPILERYGV